MSDPKKPDDSNQDDAKNLIAKRLSNTIDASTVPLSRGGTGSLKERLGIPELQKADTDSDAGLPVEPIADNDGIHKVIAGRLAAIESDPDPTPIEEALGTKTLTQPGAEKSHENQPAGKSAGQPSSLDVKPLTESDRSKTAPALDDAWQVILQPMVVGVDPTALALEISGAMIVGRSDEAVAAVVPDIDLQAYNGDKLGVSRQHALVMPSSDGIWLVDLDSTNGTWVNGLYLQPGMKYRIRSGDRLEFGTLKMLVRILGVLPVSGSQDESKDQGATLISRRKPRRD